MSLLDLRRVTMRFGGLTAVKDLDLVVEPGGISSIIGPNGAGKTTVFNVVTGVYEPTQGTLHLDGRDLRRPFTPRAALGIAAIAVLAGLLSVLVAHAEPLWEAAITSHYVYRQPFPWGESVRSFFRFLADHAGRSLLAFLLGAGVVGTGALLVWSRQRRVPHGIAARGVCRTFQNLRLFPSMTVLENVVTGMDLHLRTRLPQMLFHTPGFRREERESRERAHALLDFVGLRDRADQEARSLPYGDQRRLEIARALATRPRLLLLDEPAAGMNPAETSELMKLIERIRQSGVTVLLIEHHMKVVMGISDRIAVLNYGEKICEGTPAEVRCDPAVVEAYLGKEDVG